MWWKVTRKVWVRASRSEARNRLKKESNDALIAPGVADSSPRAWWARSGRQVSGGLAAKHGTGDARRGLAWLRKKKLFIDADAF
jgi:hypothetical protein